MNFINKEEKETQQLEQRGNRLLRYGRRFLVVAAVLAVNCLGSWLLADSYLPRIDDFTLDIPDSLISLVKDLPGKGVIDDLASGVSSFAVSLLGLMMPLMFCIAIAKAGFASRDFLAEFLKEKLKLPIWVGTTIILAVSLIVVPYSCYFVWNAVSLEMKAFANREVIDGLDQKTLTPEIKSSWSYQYLQAQKAVLSGHADKTQLQDVLKQYSASQIHHEIPAPVRYALEMHAFQQPLSKEAVGFQAAQEHKSTLWHKISLALFSGAFLLALTGLISSLLGKTVSRRVKFLRAIR